MTPKILFLLFSIMVLDHCVLGEWRWTDKVAVVTGASSGIGAEIAVQLADKGMIVAAVARREHRLQEIVQKTKGKIHPVVCDIMDEKDIIKAFKWVEENLGGVDVLVNNAGTYIISPLSSGETKDWNHMFNLNVMGTAICSREALKTMRKRGDNGQIINVNSIAGHSVMHFKDISNGVYTATKYAVTAMSEALSNELTDAGSNIKVTNLSPGLVMTELVTNVSLGNDAFLRTIQTIPHIDVDDIAESVIYVLSTKQNVHIAELTIKQMGISQKCD